MFDSLEKDAHDLLLFLRYLESIEVYERKSIHEEPVKLMHIKISSESRENVVHSRAELIDQIKIKDRDNDVIVSYRMSTELVKENTETKHWCISQYCPKGIDTSLEIREDFLKTLIPWVGVALPYDETLNGISMFEKETGGRIFCFLPLPSDEETRTGLHMHVHGYFSVEENRRHIKWPTAEQSDQLITDENLLWNQYLVSTLLPVAIINLTQFIAGSGVSEKNSDAIYASIPNKLKVTPHWQSLVELLHSRITNLAVFYTTSGGGAWVKVTDEGIYLHNSDDKSEPNKLIRRILLEDQCQVVSVPDFIFERLFKDPLLRKQLIQPTRVTRSLKNIQHNITLSDNERELLLKYLLDSKDISLELIGLQLLPLLNGSWTEFSSKQSLIKVYVDSDDHPAALLPGLCSLFLKINSVPVTHMQRLMGK